MANISQSPINTGVTRQDEQTSPKMDDEKGGMVSPVEEPSPAVLAIGQRYIDKYRPLWQRLAK